MYVDKSCYIYSTLERESFFCECKPHNIMYLYFATPWTVAYQAPLPWDFPGNSTRVDCHFLLQGIFPTQESNMGLPYYRQMLYHLSHQGSLVVSSF